MKKKILKIFSFVWLFLLFVTQTFAMDANLSVDKNSSSINDLVNLRLKISSSEWWEIRVNEIKWLENFQKVGQSQSQSSSSQIVVINWETQSKTTTTVNLDLQLKPLKNWEFEIWPAILQSWSGIIETNSVKIKIDWTSIWIFNNNVGVPPVDTQNGNNQNIWNKISGQTQRSTPTAKNVGVNSSVHPEINLDDYKWNNSELYILFWVLLLSWIWFYFLLKNKPHPNPPLTGQGELSWKDKRECSRVEGNWKTLPPERGELEGGLQDFEEKKQEIEYPKTDDKDFIKKAEIALRQKLEQKFNLENINSLTFEEIGEKIWDKLNLSELFVMINKAKYSNIITDYSKILEKIKEI